jgi:hypothetical protein
MPPVPDGGFYEQAGTCNAFEKYVLTEGSPLFLCKLMFQRKIQ